MEQTRMTIATMGNRIRALFRVHELDGDGLVTREDFKTVMAEMGFTACQCEPILAQLTAPQSKTIRYEDWVSLYHPRQIRHPVSTEALLEAASLEVGMCEGNVTPTFDKDGFADSRRPIQESQQVVGMIMECMPFLLSNIGVYLADDARDVAHFIKLDRSTSALNADDEFWQDICCLKWPAFYECLCFKGANKWQSLCKEAWAGRLECTLEVYNKKFCEGTPMVAIPARIRYDARCKAYIAHKMIAKRAPPERIPEAEQHRMRFCPFSVRQRLEPNTMQLCPMSETGMGATADSKAYPYRVLEGICGLKVGEEVELQWKVQQEAPFVWRHAHLEALQKGHDGEHTAILVFKEFDKDALQYRSEVQFGDSKMRPCTIGGFSGGLRPVSKDEAERWSLFFPQEFAH